MPNTISPLAKTLKLNGYSTSQSGKCHEVPVWQTSPSVPFDHWPNGGGFEYFYGFIGGETNQWYPALHEGTTHVEPDKTPGRGLSLDGRPDKQGDQVDPPGKGPYARQAVLHLLRAGRAAHAPHHVPKEWVDKYKGKFDQGWDKLREETFARQKKLGVIPPDCQLTQRHPEIPAWDTISPVMKKILTREMEV